MTASGIVASLGVAAVLTGAGALLLGRRPRSHAEWNESFLVGGGSASVLLFPLSVAFPGHALWVLLMLLLAAAAGAAFLRNEGNAPAAFSPMRPVDALLLAATGASVVVFVLANGRYHLLWDGVFIWATKGMLLLDEGALARDLWEGSGAEGRVGRTVGYPPFVPLLHALVGALRGGFDFDAAKPVFALFFASLLSGTWSAARALLSPRRALVPIALVAALPALSTSWAAGGYADMPQAAVLVTLVAALHRKEDARPFWRQPVPWLFGALVSMKNEGSLLAVLVLVAWGVAGALELDPVAVAREARRRVGTLALVAAFLGLRVVYVRWTVAPLIDNTYAPVTLATIGPALARVPEVASLVAREMARVWKWGLLWPAFFGGAVVLLGRRDPVRRVLAAATLAAVAAYVSTFLFTNWALELHVTTALDRILSQLAPLAVLVAVAGLTPPEDIRAA